MQALALLLLIAVAASAERAEEGRALAIAGLRARQPVERLEVPDPCALAREIASQPACLAGGDCPALRAWKRAFGPLGFRLLDPEREAAPFRAAAPLPPGLPPVVAEDSRPLLRPGIVCPVGDPRR